MWKLIYNRFQNERGAVSTLFAIVFGSGILFLAFALTSDASALYLEKRSLQNSADATSLAVASNCALGSSFCTDATSALSEAQVIADANSPDGKSAINLLCGTNPLGTCTAVPAVQCKAVSANVPNYGRVVLSTKNSDGSTKVKSPFFDYLIGNSNSEVNVSSCSQTAWGKAKAASVPLPLALTICDYLANGYKVMKDFTKPSNASCATTLYDSQGNEILPHPMNVLNGWAFVIPKQLATGGSQELITCNSSINITVGDYLDTLGPSETKCAEATGADSRTILSSKFMGNLAKKIYLPVISDTSSRTTAGTSRYTTKVVGFFAFELWGYDFGPAIGAGGCGSKSYSGLNLEGVAKCKNFSKVTGCGSTYDCIWGFFTKGIVPGVPVSPVTTDDKFPPVGAMAVELLP